MRGWFALNFHSLWGKKKRDRESKEEERLIGMKETWVICGFLFTDCPCPQDLGHVPDTASEAHCPQRPLGNF